MLTDSLQPVLQSAHGCVLDLSCLWRDDAMHFFDCFSGCWSQQ